ncbi:MAG: type II toxin-antitoxin system Phd/YefM family antitoxin [Alphaproteobacteria bacterium]|nr:type II toxin-antitoxin system Phd/YefM family antitoxin [Alphaproteobacteria bacterium]
MARPNWSVQDAKNHFSEVVEAASHGEPQTVTKHGKPAAVVLSIEEYARLRRLERVAGPSFVEHLLGMPADGGEFDRLDGRMRDPGF